MTDHVKTGDTDPSELPPSSRPTLSPEELGIAETQLPPAVDQHDEKTPTARNETMRPTLESFMEVMSLAHGQTREEFGEKIDAVFEAIAALNRNVEGLIEKVDSIDVAFAEHRKDHEKLVEVWSMREKFIANEAGKMHAAVVTVTKGFETLQIEIASVKTKVESIEQLQLNGAGAH